MSWEQIADLANGAKGEDRFGYRAELVQLVRLAATLNPDHSAGGRSSDDAPGAEKSLSAAPPVN
jgi:hypothetical protein